jgi:hypothetical protein
MDRRSRLGSLASLIAAMALALSAAGCRRDPAPTAVAHVSAVNGRAGGVEREHRAAWRPASVGLALVAGDAVRTGADSSATLRFAAGAQIRLSERSLIRLGVDAASSVHVTVELGRADVEGDGALMVNTTRGAVTVTRGTRLSVRVDGARSAYEVKMGRAVLGAGADQVVLSSGEGVALTFGEAEVERYQVQVGAAQLEPPSPPHTDAGAGAVARTPSPEAATAAAAEEPGEQRRGGRPPGGSPPAYDVTVPAGESAVIHGRQPPVVVRLLLEPPCSEGGSSLNLTARSQPGSGRARAPSVHSQSEREATFTVPSGSWTYRYRCRGEMVRSGTLTVHREGGGERLAPPTAPTNVIDGDGRRYTVLYQNRLPSLTFTWPAAPAAERYTLHVEGKAATRNYPAAAPRLRLPSGAVGEGTHQWWFAAAGGPSSPRTTITIRFDNAAVAAQVDAPRDGARVATGEEIEIAGIAIEGSTVAAGATPLETDAQGRFRGRVTAPAPGERSIAIRLVHPRGGVHYYVRRIVR